MGQPVVATLSEGVSTSRGGLLRVLGVAFGIAVLVGNTIGMGILRTPGVVAQSLPSVGLFLGVWVLGAGYALMGALTVAEVGAMHPRSGGQYPLIHRGLGPFTGFVAGWTDWLSTCGSVAAIAMVLGEYAGLFVSTSAVLAKGIAAAVILALTVLQYTGIRAGDVTQQITSLLKALALAALGVVALILGGAAAPTADPASAVSVGGAAAGFTAAAVVAALQSVIYTYDGWTGPIYFGEEVKEPGREIPKSMVGGVLVVLAIYLLLNLAFVRVLSLEEMAGDPFVAGTVATRVFGPAGEPALRVLMILSMFAAVNACLLMATRIPYAMSRDRLLPSSLVRVNRGGTPVPALLVSMVLSLLFVASTTLSSALAVIAFFFVANYALSFTTLFVLRRKEPDMDRPFRVPAYPWIPAAALLGSFAFLVAALATDTRNSLIALGLVVLSWPIYLVLARNRSAQSRTTIATGDLR
jgi:basic amino acid/polyamine antiporter, APA family